jgi:ribonucleotide monophosphatase NagD (HAD superfamily)
VVGDRLETDIAGGQALGCFTGVVLSGVSTREDATSWKPKPDFIEPDLATIVEKI